MSCDASAASAWRSRPPTRKGSRVAGGSRQCGRWVKAVRAVGQSSAAKQCAQSVKAVRPVGQRMGSDTWAGRMGGGCRLTGSRDETPFDSVAVHAERAYGGKGGVRWRRCERWEIWRRWEIWETRRMRDGDHLRLERWRIMRDGREMAGVGAPRREECVSWNVSHRRASPTPWRSPRATGRAAWAARR